MDGVKQCKHGRNFCCECHKAGDLNPAREAMKPENQRIYPVGTTRDYESELAALREELAESRLNEYNAQVKLSEQHDKLTAAEQRNAELVELLDSAFFRLDTFIEAEREMPVPSMEVLRDAILRHCPTLKPVEPGPIHVDCGECPNITDGCHGTCMKAKPTESGASE